LRRFLNPDQLSGAHRQPDIAAIDSGLRALYLQTPTRSPCEADLTRPKSSQSLNRFIKPISFRRQAIIGDLDDEAFSPAFAEIRTKDPQTAALRPCGLSLADGRQALRHAMMLRGFLCRTIRTVRDSRKAGKRKDKRYPNGRGAP
jgi:hypothetical protein